MKSYAGAAAEEEEMSQAPLRLVAGPENESVRVCALAPRALSCSRRGAMRESKGTPARALPPIETPGTATARANISKHNRLH